MVLVQFCTRLNTIRMIYFLCFLMLLLMLVVVSLFFQYLKMKRQHSNHVRKMEMIQTSLQQQQLYLKDKLQLLSNYNSDYLKRIKVLGNEIVSLQKTTIELLSNKNKT